MTEHQILLNNISLCIVYKNHCYEINLDKKVIIYRNVSGQEWGEYPEGYFDELQTQISKEDIDKIILIYHSVFDKYEEEETSSARVILSDNIIQSETIIKRNISPNLAHEDIIAIVKILDKYCEFPEWPTKEKRVKLLPIEVQDHLKIKMPWIGTERIEGYRYITTGGFGYVFLKNRERIVSIFGIDTGYLHSAISIDGFGITLTCKIDNDVTLVPGIRRYLSESVSDKSFAYIEYKDLGKLTINDQVEVFWGDDIFSFFIDGKIIAQIRRVDDCSRFESTNPTTLTEEYEDYEPYFEIEVKKGLEDHIKMIVCALPVVKF